MFGLSFQHPSALAVVLIALPLVTAIWILNFKSRILARRRYGEERLLSRISRTPSLKREINVLAVWLAVTFLLSVAAADPVLPEAPAVVSNGTMQVVVVIDVSNSMAQEYYRDDMSVPESGVPQGSFGSSLDMAKQLTTNEIMPAIRGNEIGVVGYAGRGFPQAELTFDLESVTWVLRHWMQIKDVPGIGSDYAAGLRQAVDIFDRSRHDDRERVIVLFSDGGFTGTEGDLAEVLALMEERNIRLVVVALGSPTPMSIPMYDYRDRYVGDFSGQRQCGISQHGDGESATPGCTSRRTIHSAPFRAISAHRLGEHALVKSICQRFLTHLPVSPRTGDASVCGRSHARFVQKQVRLISQF